MERKLITFEGLDGAGKSTQIEFLGDWLESKGIPYIITSDLGGTSIGQQIREILLTEKNSLHSLETEALLIAAARAEHMREVILPALQAGKVVLCDRYIHSTYAYQGYGRGVSLEFLNEINRQAIEKCLPEITIFLEIEPVEACRRKTAQDRIEKEGLALHERVYRGYQALLKEDATMVRVDARDSREKINKKIVELLKGVIW